MRMGREHPKFHTRSGWINFKSVEQRNSAMSALRGRHFPPYHVALWLERGEEGKSIGWDWEDMNSVGHVSRQRR